MHAAPGTFAYIDDELRKIEDETARGAAFERLCMTYLTTAPEYRDVIRKVWLWYDWPDRWGIDKGCDLVAETNEGLLWGIQCKSDKPSATLNKPAIDSFLSETSRTVFSYRLLIATTNRIGKYARETLSGQEKPVGEVLRIDLENAAIKWPTELDGRAERKRPLEPYEYQKAARKDVIAGFKNHDRGQLIMACGTGKTLTALWIAERLKSQRTLIIVPSLLLLDESLMKWSANSKEPFDYIAVCSSLTAGAKRHDYAMASTSELSFPTTTNVLEIRDHLKTERPRPLVVFCTYQSSDKVAEAQAGSDHVFDLAIVDEAHRCCTGSPDSLFSTVLDDTKIKAKRRLFMTATPRFFSERVKKKATEKEYDLVSMDDEKRFGPEFHVYNFGQAISNGDLADYRVAIIGTTDTQMRQFAEQGVFVRLADGDQTDARTLASQIILAKAMRKYNLRSLITFHSTIPKANKFTDAENPISLPATISKMKDAFKPDGEIWSDHISWKVPMSRRKALLRKLGDLPKNTRGIIGNKACLGEGVDVPELDGIAFIDPKGSDIAIVQAVGRAIRKPDRSKDKIATIVIPVFIDESEDEETVFASSAFKPVWQVLRGLRAHDTKLGEELDAFRLNLRRQDGGGKVRLPSNFEVDLPVLGEILDFEDAFYVRAVFSSTSVPPLTVEMILEWADAHYDRHGEYPDQVSGAVEIAPGETWTAIDSALAKGNRGLAGGNTLARVLAEHRGRRHGWDLPLTEAQILEWADAYYKTHNKKYPSMESGDVEGSGGESWGAIDSSLTKGQRGLPGGSSVAKLLAKHRVKRNPKDLPDLTEAQILEWADAYYKTHNKKYPSHESGEIDGSGGETWGGINMTLGRGRRDLAGGSTLAKLLAEHGRKRNPKDLPDLTEAQILDWADAYYKTHNKKYPNQKSGEVEGSRSETWPAIDQSLQHGRRGLASGGSLVKLLAEHRSIRNPKDLPDLTEAQILDWADAYYKTHNKKYPNQKSGEVEGSGGETWGVINLALRKGGRGLVGGRNLAKFLASNSRAIGKYDH